MEKKERGLSSKMLSPCVSICKMDTKNNACVGCFRTRAEIASWSSMSEADQLELMKILSQRRTASASDNRRRSFR